MSTIPITPDFIQGAITIESGDGYVRPWRTDYQQKELYPSIDDNLVNQMSKPVGVRVRFASSSATVTLSVLPDEVARKFDLVIGNERIDTLSLAAGETTLTIGGLPGDDATPVEVWLPYRGPVSLTTIDGDGVRPVTDPPPEVAYLWQLNYPGWWHGSLPVQNVASDRRARLRPEPDLHGARGPVSPGFHGRQIDP